MPSTLPTHSHAPRPSATQQNVRYANSVQYVYFNDLRWVSGSSAHASGSVAAVADDDLFRPRFSAGMCTFRVSVSARARLALPCSVAPFVSPRLPFPFPFPRVFICIWSCVRSPYERTNEPRTYFSRVHVVSPVLFSVLFFFFVHVACLC